MIFWKAEPVWQGQVAYIIGGGPSLLTQDATLLQGQNIIVINSSWKAFPKAQFLVFSDMRWWCDYLKRGGNFKGTIIGTSSAASGPLTHMKRRSAQGLAPERDTLMVKNTTLTAAINLAVHLGVAKIVLLGIDQKVTNNKHWHHAPHPWQPTVDCWKRQQMDLPKVAEDLRKLNVECVNASPGSALTLWPVVELADHAPRQEMRQIA